MDIEKALEAKALMEHEIKRALEKWETLTGLEVEDVYIKRDCILGCLKNEIMEVSTSVPFRR